MFFWNPNIIRLRRHYSTHHHHHHPHHHQNFVVIFTALAAILFLVVVIYGVLTPNTNGQIGRGLRKCRDDEFVVDETSKPANKGVQASVAILLDPVTSRKYFFKAHKSSRVFRQERKILYGLTRGKHNYATPGAICFMLRPEKGIVMELAGGGDLYSDSWYRADNPLRFDNYQQLVQAVAYFVASIAAVHAKGYLHNDLRPNNVIFNHPHRLQVIDFGLSRRIGKKGFHSRCTLNSPPETAFLHNHKDRYQNINSTASDWYTVGVLTHFFMAKGLFCIKTENLDDDACSPGQQEMFWPYKSIRIDPQTKEVIYDWNPVVSPFPADLSDFLSKLIIVDPLKRDFRGNKLDELLKHPLFTTIDWNIIKGE